MTVPVLSAEGVGMTFDSPAGPVEAIGEIGFDLRPGELIALVGPSGCGKTTLFNIISGLLVPSRGNVTFSAEVNDAPQTVGYMLQKDLLLPWRSVIDNVVLGLEVRGVPKAASYPVARKLIEAYGLGGFEKARPATLSGGMRQRVAIMRTLASDPALILLDEPFSALDFQTRTTLQTDVAGIIKKHGKSAILITHDIGEAITMADRVVVLTARPSRVIRTLEIEIPRDQRSPVALRSDRRFDDYFVQIWEDLQKYGKAA